ncbi:MAG: hypothetical protein ABSF52_17400 [Syntrophobacteraceae bacterium]|jgi:hypothetical protein
METISSTVSIEGKAVTFTVEANNMTIHENCPMCQEDHKDADTPYWITVDGYHVCHECAAKHVPLLLKAVVELDKGVWREDTIENTNVPGIDVPDLRPAAQKDETEQRQRQVSFSELQTDFLVGQLKDYREMTFDCLALLEHLLPNGNSGAQGEIGKIVLKEIRKRLSGGLDDIFYEIAM